MSRGVYGVDRGVWDHPLFKERKAFSRREAWLWLVSEAAWKPRRVYLGGAVIALDRGQLAHSIRFMAEAWRWEQTRVVRFFDRLKTETMIATAIESGHTVTTICNYERYQVVCLPTETPYATPIATPPQQDRNDTATNNKTLNTGNDDGGEARPNAFEIATELLKTCGHSPDFWPPGWCGSPQWVQKCLNEGWLPEIMIAETRAVVGRKRDGPIENYSYLEKPIARAHARHLAPLPKVETPQQETIYGSYSAPRRGGSAIDALEEIKRDLARGANPDAPLGLPER